MIRGDTAWMADGACVGVEGDLFFPENGANIGQALAICAGCPVRETCLQWALDACEVWGIWGGTSAKQRKKMLKVRPEKHHCQQCGNVYETKRDGRKQTGYCSDDCDRAARQKYERDRHVLAEPRHCVVCDAELISNKNTDTCNSLCGFVKRRTEQRQAS